jgi:hypothetical protein
MIRRLALALGLVMVITACGGDDGSTDTGAQPTAATTHAAADDSMADEAMDDDPMDDESMEDTGADAGSETPADDGAADLPTIEGPAAPDFTLALGDGGTYTLSEAAKPVYMVFWAEW